MPTCDPVIIHPVINQIISLKPNSVLDIGIGFGKWGALVREYGEGWNHRRYHPDQWSIKLVGIEIWYAYKNPMWHLYDRVYNGEASGIVPTLPRFDLVLMIDVLEHFEKSEGIKMIKQIQCCINQPDATMAVYKPGRAIISYANCDQAGVCNNDREDHVSKWTHEDLFSLGGTLIDSGPGRGLFLF